LASKLHELLDLGRIHRKHLSVELDLFVGHAPFGGGPHRLYILQKHAAVSLVRGHLPLVSPFGHICVRNSDTYRVISGINGDCVAVSNKGDRAAILSFWGYVTDQEAVRTA
jgi:hypothetical protein